MLRHYIPEVKEARGTIDDSGGHPFFGEAGALEGLPAARTAFAAAQRSAGWIRRNGAFFSRVLLFRFLLLSVRRKSAQ